MHPRASRCLTGAAGAMLALAGCGEGEAPGSQCGPSEAEVARVIDGDTIELASGERVRYLLIDSPESTSEQECWGAEAAQANRDLVEGRRVRLHYDTECEDDFGRLLAYVFIGEREINRLLLERGHACVLHIPPNGDEIVAEYRALADTAEALGRGLWAVCEPAPCGD